MFVGHYGGSFAGRAAEKRIPLWVLFIAVQFILCFYALAEGRPTWLPDATAEQIARFARDGND